MNRKDQAENSKGHRDVNKASTIKDIPFADAPAQKDAVRIVRSENWLVQAGKKSSHADTY